jgi:hypothetical protein
LRGAESLTGQVKCSRYILALREEIIECFHRLLGFLSDEGRPVGRPAIGWGAKRACLESGCTHETVNRQDNFRSKKMGDMMHRVLT